MRSGALATYILWISLRAAFGQATTPMPVQAEFLKPLQIHKLAAGATLLAKVTAEWSGPGCVLHAGAILEATVETAEPRKGGGRSKLALSFDRAQCDKSDLEPFQLVLLAAAAPPDPWTLVPDVEINSPRLRAHSGEPTAVDGRDEFLIPSQHLEFSGAAHHFPLKPNMRAGDILGIKGLKLEVGTGTKRSSVFSSEHGDLSLKAFTQILLNPPSVAFVTPAAPPPKSVAGAGSARPDIPARPAKVPTDTLEVCKAPGCVVDRPVMGADLDSQTPGSIDLEPIGYARRTGRLQADFDQDTALAWLGPDEVLFAYNAHPLVQRGIESPDAARMVRAVVLSASSHAVLQSADWSIHDAERFLWQLDASHILVHVGDELRVYGRGLELERTINLTGPLRFLRASPSGDSIVFGTLRERHSQELHAQLREELGAEPEEDVEITMYDKGFQNITTGITSSTLTPPTLLNEGQVSLRPQPEGDYRMAIAKWESTAATLARFKSLCPPRVSSISRTCFFWCRVYPTLVNLSIECSTRMGS